MRHTTSLPLLRRLRLAHLRLVPASFKQERARRTRSPGKAVLSFARAVELLGIAAAYATLPIWPLVAGAVARDFSYVRRYPAMLLQVNRHIRGILRGRSVSRFVTQKLFPEPARPEQISGACSHCGNCCLYRGCLFLAYDAEGRSSCRIYGSRLWNLLACGDYPASGRDISLYACPSFLATPPAAQKPLVVPIVPAGFPPRRAATSPLPGKSPLPAQRAAGMEAGITGRRQGAARSAGKD
jgi:hypothetical protein